MSTATKKQERRREVSFRVSKKDRALVTDIVERMAKMKPGIDRLSLTMDLEATHANGCRMDFAKLLAADDFNLLHDIYGINRHLNRETGKLEHCFLPRCHASRPTDRLRWIKSEKSHV